MSPRRIVAEAQRKGLDVIAVSDHNSAENVAAVVRAAEGTGLAVLPGIEVTTEEEVHILGIMPTLAAAEAIQEMVYAQLAGENNPEIFGMQPVVNQDGEILGFNPRLLIGAVRLSVDRTVEAIHSHRGLAVASHVDRKMYSLIGQLGFVPLGLPLDALEITERIDAREARRRFDRHGHYELIRGSDAHFPDQIGTASFVFLAEAATVEEIGRAIRGEEGRRIVGSGNEQSANE